MKTVLVTGAQGFVGRHVVSRLHTMGDIKVLAYDLNVERTTLPEMVAQADFVIHLAGVNRPETEAEFAVGNRDFTNELLHLMTQTNRFVPVLVSSSTQAELDNAYGRSKRAAEDLVFAWGNEHHAEVFVYRLPNVFGKWCRPNYNSVVATFCYNIAHDLPIQISDPDRLLTLVYIDEVVDEFLRAMKGRANRAASGFCSVPQNYNITLSDLAERIRSFRSIKETLVLPDLADPLTHYLHSTYLSYLPESAMSYVLEMKRDNRGWLSELVKSKHFGQMFVSRTYPGITRGNHWHHTKVEKFIVIEGQAVVRLRRIDDDKVYEFPVSGDKLQVVEILPGYTHSITNTGNTDVMTLFWANEMFDPNKPDTYPEEV